MKVLVTGSSGYLASYVIPLLVAQGHEVRNFDLPEGDVLSIGDLYRAKAVTDTCIHLAGLKYATRAETDALATVEVNVQGTANVVQVFGSNVVLSSTCKAADPETVYGCSKLIAERIVLQAGGRVVRLVNVLGSVGSVTRIWDAVPHKAPLPVCKASRLFIRADQAAELMVRALDWPVGRYATRDSREMWMNEVAGELHPGRAQVEIPLRRGDRRCERVLAACERFVPWEEDIARIEGQHDPLGDEVWST